MKNKLLKILIITVLSLCLFKFIYELTIYTASVNKNSTIKEKEIYEKNNTYNINVLYPNFTNVKVSGYINKYINNYVKNFKNKKVKNKKLIIDYNLYFLDDYVFIYFIINDNTNKKQKNHTIIINSKNKLVSNKEFIKKDKTFNSNLDKSLNKKYSTDLYNYLKDYDINKTSLVIKNKKYYITYNNINKNINYIPEVSFKYSFNDEIYTYKEINEEKYKKEKYIALTFDDGPDKVITNKVINALKENDAHATFFMIGNKISDNKEIILRQLSLGNEMGSHSFDHKNLTNITKNELYYELNKTNKDYKNITGEDILYVRPPYGSLNRKTRHIINKPIILWDIDTEDWDSKDPIKISNHVIKNAKDGDIILMHDVYPSTLEALKIMLPVLKEEGFNMVTISEMSKIKNKKLINGDSYRCFNNCY